MATTETVIAEPRGYWANAWLRLRQNRVALAGGMVIALVALVAALAPLLAPHDPTRQHRDGLTSQGFPLFHTPSYPFGTDELGRDILSRLIVGGRISYTIGVTASLISVALGVLVGALAGFFPGWPETVLMRLVDTVMGVPSLLLAVGLMATFDKPTPTSIILVVGMVGWTYLARIVYAEVQCLRAQEFVVAAWAVGVPTWRILQRHILPHLVSVITVYLTLNIPYAVMLEATLSYVGIGVQPPTPSWGNMIRDGQRIYLSAPWIITYPGLALVLTVLGFNLLGEGLRDALDPRHQKH